MSFTLADVQAGVQARGYQTDTAAPQLTIAQSVLRRIFAMRRWPFLESTATAALAAGASTVPVPAGVDRVDAVRLSSGTDHLELAYLPYQELRDYWYNDRTADEPDYWSLGPGEGTISVWPVPDRAYTVDLDTIVAATIPPDAVTPVSLLPDEFREVVIFAVCADMAARQRDWNAANYWTSSFQTALLELVKSYAIVQRQSPREVARWDGWTNVER